MKGGARDMFDFSYELECNAEGVESLEVVDEFVTPAIRFLYVTSSDDTADIREDHMEMNRLQNQSVVIMSALLCN